MPDALGLRCLAVLGEAPQHLLREERVARSALVKLGGQRSAGFGTQPALGELWNLFTLEAAYSDAVEDAVALEVRERCEKRTAAPELGISVSPKDQHRRAAPGAQHERQQQQRGAI